MDAVVPGQRTVSAHRRRLVTGSGAKFKPNDILFARITPCLENGKIAQYRGAEPGFGSTEFFVLRARQGISLPEYVFYFALNPELRAAAEKSMVGASGRQRAAISSLADFGCEFPPLPVQRRIAGILSAYDELIENSQRRIGILEAMARALYREWFVHFRFPGHEKTKLVASLLGDIPQGWEVKRVPECVDINPRVVVPRDGEKPFVPMGCLSNDSMLITGIGSRGGNSGAKFQNDDTLFARITPCLENGKTGFVQFLPDADTVACGSTEFIVLRSRTLTPEFVYCLARSDEFRGVAIKSMSGASGRQRVQQQCFDDFQVVQPPRALLNRFSTIVAPSFRLIYKLHLQIQNLRQTRDLLLPRLLSGQINLKEN
jgi:type I restriction enzyme S subunit